MPYQLITDGSRITQGPSLTTGLPFTFSLYGGDGSANIYNQNYVAGWKKQTLGWVKQGGAWKPEASFMKESSVQKTTQVFVNNPSSVSLEKNTISLSAGNPTMSFQSAIGLPAYGGIIAYILQPGDPGYDANAIKGIVRNTTSIPNNVFGDNNQYGYKNTAIGQGESNTLLWISTYGSYNGGSYAAADCRNLTTNGYTDWFLPSKDELQKLYDNRNLIGGLPGNWVWTSTESAGNTNYKVALFVPSNVMGDLSPLGPNAMVACRYFTA